MKLKLWTFLFLFTTLSTGCGTAPFEACYADMTQNRTNEMAVVVPAQMSQHADLFVPNRADLIAGGSLAPDVSLLAALSLAPSLSVPILTLGLHNLAFSLFVDASF